MKYAVIKIQGKQYKILEGEELLVDRLGKIEKPEFQTLLVVDGEECVIGEPQVKGAIIDLKVLGEEKSKKLDIIRYKAKSRYKKKIGFRHSYSRMKVERISVKI